MMYDQDIQQNQYQSGPVSNPDYNTAWMAPTSPMFGGNINPTPTQTPTQTTQPSQNNTSLGPSIPSNINSGTLVDSVANGNWNGNPGYTGSGPLWVPPQQNQNQQVQQLDYNKLTPMAGWETSKLMDPNKHDPKYDWLRAVQMIGSNSDLGAVVNYYNQLFGANNGMANFTGGDKVDFGGGVGPVDVLFDQEGKRENLWAPIWGNSSFTGPNGQAMPQQSMNGLNNAMMNSNALKELMQQIFTANRNAKLHRYDRNVNYNSMPSKSDNSARMLE